MTLDEAKQEATDAMNAYPNSCPRINIYATNILFFADTIAELEAHNRQLLNDKDASPAIIAGYRGYNAGLRSENERLEAEVRELEHTAKMDGAYGIGRLHGMTAGRKEQQEKDEAIINTDSMSLHGYVNETANACIRAIREQDDE